MCARYMNVFIYYPRYKIECFFYCAALYCFALGTVIVSPRFEICFRVLVSFAW